MTFDPSLHLDDLPLEEAQRVRYLEQAVMWLDARMNKSRLLAGAALELTARLSALRGAAGRAVSAKTLERLYYRWKNGTAGAAPMTWQTLLDTRSAAAKRRISPTAQRCFTAHLALLASRHPRSLRSAVEELYTEWRTCQTIPGYEGRNYRPDMPLPKGWSVDNITRRMPQKTALAVIHQGVRAVADRLPMVYATRAGCWPCSHVMFDDVWLDCLASGYDAQGRPHLDRPLQLGCLDMYTGKRLCWGTKLRTKAEDGHSVQLNGDEMLYLLCDYLLNVGYSRRGTVLVMEHGTATISKELEEKLLILTHGMVRVERSGITGTRQVGAYGGRGVGNPRFKTELEVWHSLLHNRMDGERTQVGKEHTEPEKLWGIRAAEQKLLAAGQTLTTDRALALMPTAKTLSQLCDDLSRIVVSINCRTDHNLEGWAACGFVKWEYSINGTDGWLDLAGATPEIAATCRAMAAAGQGTLRQRNLSPQEAWEQSVALPGNELVRLTPAECVELLGAARKFPITVRGGAIKLDSAKRHHEQLLFAAEVTDIHGCTHQLPAGRGLFGVFNPMGQNLFIVDERNRVLGVAPLLQRFPHHDEAARLRQFGDTMRRRAEQLAALENIVAPDTNADNIRADYNRRVMTGEPIDPLGVADAKALKRLTTRTAPRTRAAAAPAPLPVPDGLGLADSYTDTPFPHHH